MLVDRSICGSGCGTEGVKMCNLNFIFRFSGLQSAFVNSRESIAKSYFAATQSRRDFCVVLVRLCSGVFRDFLFFFLFVFACTTIHERTDVHSDCADIKHQVRVFQREGAEKPGKEVMKSESP